MQHVGAAQVGLLLVIQRLRLRVGRQCSLQLPRPAQQVAQTSIKTPAQPVSLRRFTDQPLQQGHSARNIILVQIPSVVQQLAKPIKVLGVQTAPRQVPALGQPGQGAVTPNAEVPALPILRLLQQGSAPGDPGMKSGQIERFRPLQCGENLFDGQQHPLARVVVGVNQPQAAQPPTSLQPVQICKRFREKAAKFFHRRCIQRQQTVGVQRPAERRGPVLLCAVPGQGQGPGQAVVPLWLSRNVVLHLMPEPQQFVQRSAALSVAGGQDNRQGVPFHLLRERRQGGALGRARFPPQGVQKQAHPVQPPERLPVHARDANRAVQPVHLQRPVRVNLHLTGDQAAQPRMAQLQKRVGQRVLLRPGMQPDVLIVVQIDQGPLPSPAGSQPGQQGGKLLLRGEIPDGTAESLCKPIQERGARRRARQIDQRHGESRVAFLDKTIRGLADLRFADSRHAVDQQERHGGVPETLCDLPHQRVSAAEMHGAPVQKFLRFGLRVLGRKQILFQLLQQDAHRLMLAVGIPDHLQLQCIQKIQSCVQRREIVVILEQLRFVRLVPVLRLQRQLQKRKTGSPFAGAQHRAGPVRPQTAAQKQRRSGVENPLQGFGERKREVRLLRVGTVSLVISLRRQDHVFRIFHAPVQLHQHSLVLLDARTQFLFLKRALGRDHQGRVQQPLQRNVEIRRDDRAGEQAGDQALVRRAVRFPELSGVESSFERSQKLFAPVELFQRRGRLLILFLPQKRTDRRFHQGPLCFFGQQTVPCGVTRPAGQPRPDHRRDPVFPHLRQKRFVAVGIADIAVDAECVHQVLKCHLFLRLLVRAPGADRGLCFPFV